MCLSGGWLGCGTQAKSTCRKDTGWSEPLFSWWVHTLGQPHWPFSCGMGRKNIQVHHHQKNKNKISGNVWKIVTSILRFLLGKHQPQPFLSVNISWISSVSSEARYLGSRYYSFIKLTLSELLCRWFLTPPLTTPPIKQ